MGIIRHTRRHDQSPAGNASYLIPVRQKHICTKTNQVLDQARDLMAKAVQIKDGKELTNPTI